MSIDVKEMREGVTESEETLANATTGAIASVVDAASDPVDTVRETVHRFERRGEPINRRLERRIQRTAEKAMDATGDLVTGNLAERLTLRGIHLAKDRARRRDTVGDVLFRSIELLHRGLNSYVHEVGKFQNATQPPTRNDEHRSSSSTRRSRRTSRSRRSTRSASARKSA